MRKLLLIGLIFFGLSACSDSNDAKSNDTSTDSVVEDVVLVEDAQDSLESVDMPDDVTSNLSEDVTATDMPDSATED